MRVLVIVVVIVVVIVTWESKANSSSSLTDLQTGTELGNTIPLKTNYLTISLIITYISPQQKTYFAM